MKSGCAHELLTLDLNVMTTASIKNAFAVLHSFCFCLCLVADSFSTNLVHASLSVIWKSLNKYSACYLMSLFVRFCSLCISESKTRSLILFSSNDIQSDTVNVIIRNWIRPSFRSVFNIILFVDGQKKPQKLNDALLPVVIHLTENQK